MSINENVIVNPARLTGARTVAMVLGHATQSAADVSTDRLNQEGAAMTRPHDGQSPAAPTSVLVCFHAHPDDEVFTTGGVMRLASDAGHRVNRDQMVRLMASNPQWAAETAPPDASEFGLPESEITTVVDVRAALAAKRAAMAAHESQVGDFGPFLAMPDEQVEAAFGQESFRRRGGATGQQRGTTALETALPL